MRKSMPQVLAEFTKHLFEHDPMWICYPDNHNRETEYDAEALSILSRFVEGHLVAMSRDDAISTAHTIIQSAFAFWFGRSLVDDDSTHQLSLGLLDLYVAAYPEQKTALEVVSDHEERVGDGSSGLPGIAPGEASPGRG